MFLALGRRRTCGANITPFNFNCLKTKTFLSGTPVAFRVGRGRTAGLEPSVEPLKSEMAFEILAYLVHHPKAQDTFEGIVEWWLLERYIERQRAAVEAAMEELVG